MNIVLLQPQRCEHFGFLLWRTHAEVYCPNCGFNGYDASLLGIPTAHKPGEMVEGFFDPNEIPEELR